ncbi:MAG: EAL domain-containing protein [Campylobacterota bacterium]
MGEESLLQLKLTALESDVSAREFFLQFETNIESEISEKKQHFTLAIILFLTTNAALLLYYYMREQKSYKSSISEVKEKAVAILNSIGDAVVITDVYGNISFLNPVAEKLIERTGKEVEGLYIDDVLDLWSSKTGKKIKTPIDDVLYANVTKLISDSTKLISKSGKEYIISDSVSPIKDENENLIGTVLVFQNNTDKYETDEENERLKERTELALLGSQAGIWDWNTVTNEVYFSPRWKEMIGYRDDELENEFSSWESRVYHDDLKAIYVGLEENMEGKTDRYEGVHRLRHKDGHWVWILSRGKALFDEDGKAVRMSGTHIDISQQKKVEQKLLKKTREFKAIYEGSKDAIAILDTESNFLQVNQAYVEMTGMSEEELLATSCIALSAPEDIERSKKVVKEALKVGFVKNYEKRCLVKNGEYINVDMSISLLKDPDRLLTSVRDVTKRKNIEECLAIQYSLLNTIVDTVPVRIFWKDVDGVYLGANRLFLDDGQIDSADDIIGKTDYDMPWGETEAQLYRDDDLAVIESDVAKINFEETQTDDKGNTVTLLTSKIPLKDTNGKMIGILGNYVDITDQRNTEEELRKQKDILAHQAHHDALTGLPNRTLFNDRLEQATEKAKRNNTKVALLFIDLDHFKEINDSLGHDVGDTILTTVTQRLEETIRDQDTLARLGGDEFTIVLEDLLQGEDASLLAQKILESLAKPINVEDNALYVSSSIGISLYPDDGDSSTDLLKYADSAMYRAKDEGRNNFQFYSAEMTELAFERVVMETNLREALKSEDFIVYYQPQVNGVENRITGMEALIRWKHHTMGIVSPAKFIPIAESTGLIVELDRFVMKTAMRQFADWYAKGLNPGVLAMNLSIKQLRKKDFITVFDALIKETGCKSEWLELEVTEGQIMKKPEESIEILNQINELGVELAIDDFGTGYSSLSHLKKLPINKLKIDQSFVMDLPDDEEDVAISRAVIALAKSLNLKVVAEGVETREQKDFIVENGCDNIQGYFYAKPMPADELERVLLEGLTS